MRLTLLFLIALLIGSNNETKIEKLEMSANNPFNVKLNEPIAYANVTATDLEAYVNVTITNAVLELENIIQII